MSSTTFIPREDVVRIIAGHPADRDRWLLVSLTADLPALPDLGSLPDYTAYLDNGTGAIGRITPPSWPLIGALIEVLPPLPITLVATVPKTVSPQALSTAIGQHVGDDGGQDILLLSDEDGRRYYWPSLFMDALRIVDSKVAAHIAANDLRIQS